MFKAIKTSSLFRLSRFVPALALSMGLAACATYSPRNVRPGMTEQEAVAVMGPPFARHAQPGGGMRLEYPRGPAGLHTFMVDVDAQGRVTGWQQVLTEAQFNAVPQGATVQELRRRLGRPAQVRGGGLQPGQVWSYRFDSPFCQWWQVSVVQDRVGPAAYGPDPRCELGDRERDRP
jgi:hypothetical protein